MTLPIGWPSTFATNALTLFGLNGWTTLVEKPSFLQPGANPPIAEALAGLGVGPPKALSLRHHVRPKFGVRLAAFTLFPLSLRCRSRA